MFTREKSVRVLKKETVLIFYCPKRNSGPTDSFKGNKINPISSKTTFTTQIYLPAKLLTMQLQARPINPDIVHHCLSSDLCHSIWTTGCNRYPAMPVSVRDNICNYSPKIWSSLADCQQRVQRRRSRSVLLLNINIFGQWSSEGGFGRLRLFDFIKRERGAPCG